MSAFLSGEMKDTVQINPAGAYGREHLFFHRFARLTFIFAKFSSDFFLERNARNFSAAGQVAPVCGSRWDTLYLALYLLLCAGILAHDVGRRRCLGQLYFCS